MNGRSFTQYIEILNLDIKTLTVPHYEINNDIIEKLKNKPVAIILNENNADYPNLPMYEYNRIF